MKLKIEGLQKTFEKKEVLKNINFTFEKGKIYGLLGKNGAGKTTLFNCLNEDIPTDGGSFYIEENGEIRDVISKDIGYVLSTPVVPEFLTGREFLQFFIDVNGAELKDKKTVDEYFEIMKIDVDDRNKIIKDYSHGMKNKVQLLVNLIAKPNVLLLDEPLTSFDVLVAEEMKNLLLSIKNDHIIIFSTHIMELALELCDEIVILNEGELELIDNSNLTTQLLKEKVIKVLKGELDDESL